MAAAAFSFVQFCFAFPLIFRSYSSSPARAVLMAPGRKDGHPEEGHDEAEHRDEHHPAQRVRWVHVGRRHQDPNQTAKYLQTGKATNESQD